MEFTRIPYFFFFLQKSDNLVTNKDIVILKGEEYRAVAEKKFIYLALRYIPFIFLAFLVFNKYDFSMSNEKILQYGISIVLFIAIVLFKRVGFIFSIATMLVIGFMGILNVISIENMDMSYIFKYLLLILLVYDFYKGINLKIYKLVDRDGRIKSHLVKENN